MIGGLLMMYGHWAGQGVEFAGYNQSPQDRSGEIHGEGTGPLTLKLAGDPPSASSHAIGLGWKTPA